MEEAVQFTCNHKRLYGVLHLPPGMTQPSVFVIVVTGGPQVRSGPHRLYVHLSRFLSDHGLPSLRFDYEGMGDSEGDFVGFQHAGPSIAAAMEFLQERFSSDLDFVFWSLCDGATATALYCATCPERVKGMVLCNPLILTDEGLARSTIRHYYCHRLLDREFWRKLMRFDLDFGKSIRSIWAYIKDAQFFPTTASPVPEPRKLPEIIFDKMHRFPVAIRVILSTDDIVASNFLDELNKNRILEQDYQTGRIMNITINGADHTFIHPDAREKMFAITLQSLNEMVSV